MEGGDVNNKTISGMKCILYLFVLLALPAQAASFDCAKVGTKIEKLICGDAELSKLDEELSAAYKAAVQDKTKAKEVKQAQKQWMKERNSCADAGCVKGAYEAQLSSLAGTHTSSDDSAATKDSAKDNSQNGQPYHFQLTKGKGVQVCDAYLERLNTTVYIKPPYCDRPEIDTVKGFVRLNRVPLSPADVRDLYPIVWTFMSSANQDIDWTDMNLQQRLTQTGQAKLTEAGVKSLQMDLDGGWAKMWRYDPPIDIDNDGKPDNVEVWHGYAVGGVGGKQCGADITDKFPGDPPLRQPQIAFVVKGRNDRLDVSTVKIFGHPKGGYPIYMDGHWRMADSFRPAGKSIGIFKYQDIYYFDTFFDGWGDFENKRQTVYTQSKNMQIANTLAIFLHKNGKTKQVCEYLMTDNKSQTERGTK